MQKNQKRRNKIIILYTLLLLGMGVLMLESKTKAKCIPITKENFPDKYVRKEIKKYDKNKNRKLEKKEQKKIRKFTVYKGKGNLDIKGISKCKYIKELCLYAEEKMVNEKEICKLNRLKIYSVQNANRSFDINKIESIKELNLYVSNLKKIRIKNCKALKILNIEECKKTNKIEIRNNKDLRRLHISANAKLQEVTIEKNKNIRNVIVSGNHNIKKIKIHDVPKINYLLLGNFHKKFQQLDLEKMKCLRSFHIGDTPLTTIELDKMPNLEKFRYSNNNFELLDFTKVPKLKSLSVSNSSLKELDVSMLQLEDLNWKNGKLRNVKVNNNTIRRLDLTNNQLSGTWDLNLYPKLIDFYCDNNKIEKIIATNHQHINTVSCENNNLQEFNGLNAWEFYIFYGKGNPNAKLYFYYPKEDSHTNYSFDKTATVQYEPQIGS